MDGTGPEKQDCRRGHSDREAKHLVPAALALTVYWLVFGCIIRVNEARAERAVTQPASQPATAPASRPTSAPASQPATAPASQPTSAPASQPTSAPASQPAPAIADEDEETTMLEEEGGEAEVVPAEFRIVRSRAVGTIRKPAVPRYVRTLDKIGEQLGSTALKDNDWLEFGLEQRTRFEHRDDYYRENLETDDRFLMRTRGFVGIRKILDPFRLGFEFQDSRRFGSRFDQNTGDINEADILQAFAELYFSDAFGTGQALSLRAGRISFDAIDRRLFASNNFRNTTNALNGFRIRMGQPRSPWEVDIFAGQPVERRLTSPDPGDEERWIYGTTAYWRKWSPLVVLNPYYLILDRDGKGPSSTVPSFVDPESFIARLDRARSADTRSDRLFHTLGLHGFGLIGETGFDYDVDVAFQFGDDDGLRHRAFASHAEIGYAFDHAWNPRLAFWVDYASGDRDPDDRKSQRFNRLFGASHSMYGYSDLFIWANTINPSLYFSARPIETVRLEAFYRTYWLASDRDAWVRAKLRDPTGQSGNFIGQEIDLRVRHQITPRMGLEVGYAHFIPGSFVRRTTESADDSDFFYVQLTWRF